MLRITEIKVVPNYHLICRFNSGELRQLAVLPLIESHKHLNGVGELLNGDTFKKVQIGQFGEIVWEKIVKTEYNGEVLFWDYDISPEFAYQNSTTATTYKS
jgi:hypothetical protein